MLWAPIPSDRFFLRYSRKSTRAKKVLNDGFWRNLKTEISRWKKIPRTWVFFQKSISRWSVDCAHLLCDSSNQLRPGRVPTQTPRVMTRCISGIPWVPPLLSGVAKQGGTLKWSKSPELLLYFRRRKKKKSGRLRRPEEQNRGNPGGTLGRNSKDLLLKSSISVANPYCYY